MTKYCNVYIRLYITVVSYMILISHGGQVGNGPSVLLWIWGQVGTVLSQLKYFLRNVKEEEEGCGAGE